MSNPFRKALELFDDGTRWDKGEYASVDDNGRVVSWCLLGVLRHIKYGNQHDTLADETPTILMDVIVEQYPDRSAGGGIEDWNDNEETCWNDVEVVLEKAAVKFDERAGLTDDCRVW